VHPGLSQAIGAAPQVKGVFDALGGPGAALGRFLGFGQAELRAGVPGWAWFLMGAGAGAVAMWFGKDQIDDYVRRAG
jgi:hypothetical protein